MDEKSSSIAVTARVAPSAPQPPVVDTPLRVGTPAHVEGATFLDSLTTLTGSVPTSESIAIRHEIRVASTAEELRQFELPWFSCCDRACGPMEQFDWALACLQDSQDRKWNVSLVLRNGQLVAAAPLVTQRIRGVAYRVMPGVETYYEPTSLLAVDSDALSALAEHLAASGAPLICGRLPADSPVVDALSQAFKNRGIVQIRPERSCPVIRLSASWATPEMHLNSGRRSDLRRARRRAEELGAIETQIITPKLAELDALLEEAFRIESASWKGREGTALLTDAARGDFYRRYAHAACERGALRICFLRLGGRAIAMQIAVVQSNRLWLLKIGYDAEYSRCSPGMLLIQETIAYAVREGLDAYEFLGTSESWTEVWTKDERQCVSLTVYPRSIAGTAALASNYSIRGATKIKGALRQGAKAVRAKAGQGLTAVVKRAARGYIAGDSLADAERVKRRIESRGLTTTIGYWDAEGELPRKVANEYLAGLDLLGRETPDGYLSIKLPSLGFSPALLKEIAEKAVAVNRRLHFDALGSEHAAATRTAVEQILSATPGLQVSYTLPGRWKRSLEDADWAAQQRIPVRVVKGQWADPADPERDPAAGYLEVIDRVAGNAQHVSVATHDVQLSAEAIGRLKHAGTSCDVELLYGLPMRALIRQAREKQLPCRIYVPYGAAYLPYAVSKLKSNRRIGWWLLRDAVAAPFTR